MRGLGHFGSVVSITNGPGFPMDMRRDVVETSKYCKGLLRNWAVDTDVMQPDKVHCGVVTVVVW